MTIKELIDSIKDLPQDSIVLFDYGFSVTKSNSVEYSTDDNAVYINGDIN